MNYEENTLLISEFMGDPIYESWVKLGKKTFPYHLLQYHKKWYLLKPVVDKINNEAGINRMSPVVRRLLSHSIADKIEDIYKDVVDTIIFLKPINNNAG
jgi:hypothetical protein